MKYCTYRSTHPTGFYYSGKGITDRVTSGAYKGSGVAFNVTCMGPGYEPDTWTTVVLETFATEQEAFDAEAILVPLTALIDPFCLNQQEGGLKGRGRNRSLILRQAKSKKKRETRERLAAKRKEKEALLKAQLKAARAKSKSKK